MNGETSVPRSSTWRGHGLGIRGRDQVTPLYGGALVPAGVVCLTHWHRHTSTVPGVGATRRTCAGTGIR